MELKGSGNGIVIGNLVIAGVVAVSCSAAGVTVVAVREARGRGLSGSSDVAGDLEERKRRRRLVGEQSAAGAARW